MTYPRDLPRKNRLSSSAAMPSAVNSNARLLVSSAALVGGRMTGGNGVAVGVVTGVSIGTVGVAGPRMLNVT